MNSDNDEKTELQRAAEQQNTFKSTSASHFEKRNIYVYYMVCYLQNISTFQFI